MAFMPRSYWLASLRSGYIVAPGGKSGGRTSGVCPSGATKVAVAICSPKGTVRSLTTGSLTRTGASGVAHHAATRTKIASPPRNLT